MTTPKDYSHYRLVVTARKDASATVFQIAEIEYFALLAANTYQPGMVMNLSPALSKGEEVFYDLNGRRVAKPTKGIFIMNGKKVVKN